MGSDYGPDISDYEFEHKVLGFFHHQTVSSLDLEDYVSKIAQEIHNDDDLIPEVLLHRVRKTILALKRKRYLVRSKSLVRTV